MARPAGILLTAAESEVLRKWRDDALTLTPGTGGRNAILADALELSEPHLTSGLSGAKPISEPVVTALLRMVADSDAASGTVYLLHLEARGTPEMRDRILMLRRVPREAPRPVGRGRAAMVGGVVA